MRSFKRNLVTGFYRRVSITSYFWEIEIKSRWFLLSQERFSFFFSEHETKAKLLHFKGLIWRVFFLSIKQLMSIFFSWRWVEGLIVNFADSVNCTHPFFHFEKRKKNVDVSDKRVCRYGNWDFSWPGKIKLNKHI